MKYTGTMLWNILLVSAIIISGCSKKDDGTDNTNTKGGADYVEPTLAKDTLIRIPASMEQKANSGTDYNLTLGVIEINLVNTFSTQLTSAFFYDKSTMDGWQASKNSDGSKTYSWKYLQYTVNLTYFHSSDESWWKYELDSASHTLPLYYIEDKGTSGKTEWYNPNNYLAPSQLLYRDTWTKSGGNTNSTFNIYNDDGSVKTQYVSTSNADKSGTLKVYELNSTNSLVLQWDYQWNSAGNGTYTNYQEDGTTVNFTGTF